eukprot:10869415-Alexandrium_andersonii.AAC.1
MVNRIFQKGYESSRALLGRMQELGGCGYQAFHWFIALRDLMIARRCEQEHDSMSGQYMYPRSMVVIIQDCLN